MFNLGSTDILNIVGSDDPLYNLRQVEQILANYPSYNWYDVMSLYPTGSTIYWGALFPEIVAFCCKIVGATTRPEIIGVGLLVPPLLAAILVPIMYLVGKTCGDWKTGLVAAGFTAVVSGQFFYRSFYGYMDHHIAEVFFATIFCLCYMYTLISVKGIKIDLKNFSSLKKPLLVTGLAGIAYLLGLFTMPTMILFAMIVGIFTLAQFIIDVHRNRSTEYIVFINTITFTIAIIGLLIFGLFFGLKNDGINFSNYSTGHIYAYLVLIGGTYFLYRLAAYLKQKEKPKYYFPGVLVGITAISMIVLYVISPQTYGLLLDNIIGFFGQPALSLTVQEARAWSLDAAWVTFNYGLVLMVGGALVLLYNNIKEERPHQVFALIWLFIISYSTWQHVRYEYYLAINVALLSAICVSFCFDYGWNEICRLAAITTPDKEKQDKPEEKKENRRNKKQRKKEKNIPKYDYVATTLVIVASLLAILFVYNSASIDYFNSSSNAIRMNGDWKESLEWMATSTPDTGVNYFTIYDKKTFTYPNQSYGVMSWWDYGHMITYIAKRIPNANPFQQGVAGSTGSAAYFLAQSESGANRIADVNGIRYVITDIEMDTGKFWAMATWYNASAGITPYQIQFAVANPDTPNQYQGVVFNTQSYYMTMVSRFHNFDGSMTEPQLVYYIEYTDPNISGISVPVIINGGSTGSVQEAHIRAELYNSNAPVGYHAAVFSPAIFLPIEHIPALNHYRLVHESPSSVLTGNVPNIKYVKIFEYVKGANIKGDGIIEIPVITNTGRKFTYRQESTNGEFIVPYSTSGNPYSVMATGKYRITGSGKEFDVSEDAVMQGLAIN
jgi:dolichyl-diphosphooligosaccharide--protein glycosyltransferase